MDNRGMNCLKASIFHFVNYSEEAERHVVRLDPS